MFGLGFPPGAPEPDAAPVEPLTTHALWEWLMKHGATDWHTTATRLTHTFHITLKETQP